MRIRKHAKLSPLLYTSSPLPNLPILETTICHLNQSPWDVVTFSQHQHSPPPLHHQVGGEDSLLVNGSLCDSIGALESVASMKLSSFDDNAKEIKEYDMPKWGDPDDVVVVEARRGGSVYINMEDPPLKKVENIVEDVETFCSKIDSKGWQCHKIAKSGHSFCEHHLLSRLNKNKNGSNNLLARENSLEHRRRVRPKKASAHNDQNDYYYYSGFGPKWGGKRRGGQFNSSNINNGSSKNYCNDETTYLNVSHLGASNVEGGELLGSSRIEYGELDYMVDEDDEEDDGGSLKKRARKPVKARSLKSLM